MTPKLFTTEEFATLIHRHPETVHRLRRKGRLSYVLINRTPMYREEDLAAFIAANLVEPDSHAEKPRTDNGGHK